MFMEHKEQTKLFDQSVICKKQVLTCIHVRSDP